MGIGLFVGGGWWGGGGESDGGELISCRYSGFIYSIGYKRSIVIRVIRGLYFDCVCVGVTRWRIHGSSRDKQSGSGCMNMR